MRRQVYCEVGQHNHARRRPPRRGAIIVLTAVLMIVLMALLALSIDTGYMYTMQTELDRSVDAAALAGAASLVEGPDTASDKVVEYLVRNPVGDNVGAISNAQLAEFTATFLADHSGDYSVAIGNWNATTGQLEPAAQFPSAVEVSMTYPNLPLFFGRVLGKDSFSVEARAIAMYQPRDIALVLDYSGSMNDDSELKSIGSLGYDVVMANLEQIYGELGSPQYGLLEFLPKYITVQGPPPGAEGEAQIDVEYRYRSASVSSSLNLTSVVLQFANGASQTFSELAGTTGTFAGTGTQDGQVIEYVSVTSGDTSGQVFDFSAGSFNNVAIAALELDSISYPYPSGSWSDYLNYGKTSSNNRNAGFEYQFGFANLINYWLERKPAYSQTPDLWKVSAQPVTAVKNSVSVFMDYIRQVDTNDRLALVVYNAPDGDSLVETPLTTDLDLVATITAQRQAGHYHSYTNIGAGMEAARLELEQNARAGAFKMIVLMTDGRANWNNGGYDTTAARNHVLSEAYAAEASNIPVVTISLGAGADIDLMNQVAEITKSRTFNVPGGQSALQYRDGLYQVFRDIADHRPLKLVQ